jgi:hypothetical protein
MFCHVNQLVADLTQISKHFNLQLQYIYLLTICERMRNYSRNLKIVPLNTVLHTVYRTGRDFNI